MTFHESKLFWFQQVKSCKGPPIFFFFLRLYEVCAKALKKNASALPAVHAMYVNLVSILRHCW